MKLLRTKQCAQIRAREGLTHALAGGTLSAGDEGDGCSRSNEAYGRWRERLNKAAVMQTLR